MIKFSKQILSNTIKKIQYFNSISKLPSPDIEKDINFPLAKQLRLEGIVQINDFHTKSIAANKILTYYDNLDKKLLKNKINIRSTNNIKNSFKTRCAELFNKKDLFNLANDKIILENIKQYFGFKPVLRFLSVWIDYPNPEANNEILTQNFHRDPEDFRLIKVFLLLNDINENNGPFEFINSSHLHPWKNYYKQNKTKDIYYKNNKITSCTGKRGTLIMADTNGLHRGKKIKKNFRVMAVINYVSHKPRLPFLDSVLGL